MKLGGKIAPPGILFFFNFPPPPQKKHSKSQTHVQCILPLKLFAKQETFHLNLDRLILRGFIGAVCYVADQELPFRGHDDSSILLNVGNFLELLKVLKNFGPLLEKSYEVSNCYLMSNKN